MKAKVEHRVPAVTMLTELRATQVEAWPRQDMVKALVFPAFIPSSRSV